MKQSIITIIPARYASTRFPGKPLANLLGKPMIQYVVEQAQTIGSRIVVATDDKRIYDCVTSLGTEAVMTSAEHKTGTDRCIEAYELIGRGEEIMLNLQGDEPFIQREQISTLLEAFTDERTEIATLAEPFATGASDAELHNPNIVKLVRGTLGQALYFSRSVIPYQRAHSNQLCLHHTYYKHIGLYAFRTSILADLKQLPTDPLEQAESLEQLRWLSAGYKIGVRTTNLSTIGIDTPEDLERACELLRQQTTKHS